MRKLSHYIQFLSYSLILALAPIQLLQAIDAIESTQEKNLEVSTDNIDFDNFLNLNPVDMTLNGLFKPVQAHAPDPGESYVYCGQRIPSAITIEAQNNTYTVMNQLVQCFPPSWLKKDQEMEVPGKLNTLSDFGRDSFKEYMLNQVLRHQEMNLMPKVLKKLKKDNVKVDSQEFNTAMNCFKPKFVQQYLAQTDCSTEEINLDEKIFQASPAKNGMKLRCDVLNSFYDPVIGDEFISKYKEDKGKWAKNFCANDILKPLKKFHCSKKNEIDDIYAAYKFEYALRQDTVGAGCTMALFDMRIAKKLPKYLIHLLNSEAKPTMSISHISDQHSIIKDKAVISPTTLSHKRPYDFAADERVFNHCQKTNSIAESQGFLARYAFDLDGNYYIKQPSATAMSPIFYRKDSKFDEILAQNSMAKIQKEAAENSSPAVLGGDKKNGPKKGIAGKFSRSLHKGIQSSSGFNNLARATRESQGNITYSTTWEQDTIQEDGTIVETSFSQGNDSLVADTMMSNLGSTNNQNAFTTTQVPTMNSVQDNLVQAYNQFDMTAPPALAEIADIENEDEKLAKMEEVIADFEETSREKKSRSYNSKSSKSDQTFDEQEKGLEEMIASLKDEISTLKSEISEKKEEKEEKEKAEEAKMAVAANIQAPVQNKFATPKPAVITRNNDQTRFKTLQQSYNNQAAIAQGSVQANNNENKEAFTAQQGSSRGPASTSTSGSAGTIRKTNVTRSGANTINAVDADGVSFVAETYQAHGVSLNLSDVQEGNNINALQRWVKDLNLNDQEIGKSIFVEVTDAKTNKIQTIEIKVDDKDGEKVVDVISVVEQEEMTDPKNKIFKDDIARSIASKDVPTEVNQKLLDQLKGHALEEKSSNNLEDVFVKEEEITVH